MKSKKIKTLACSIAIMLTVALSACKTEAPGEYDTAEVGKIKKVVPGVVVSMRPVRLHNQNAEIGITSAANRDAANAEAPVTGSSHGFEYVIKLNSGGIISVVQAEKTKLKPKQHILVIYGQNTRVVADNGSEKF